MAARQRQYTVKSTLKLWTILMKILILQTTKFISEFIRILKPFGDKNLHAFTRHFNKSYKEHIRNK